MNYELAKQLKDAGFPQKSAQPEDCLEGDFDCESCGSHLVYNPSLSELIEACGEDFQGLLKGTFMVWNKDKKNYEDFIGFFAGELDGTDGSCLYVDSEPHGYGSTPEEAVAKLWLELNK